MLNDVQHVRRQKETLTWLINVINSYGKILIIRPGLQQIRKGVLGWLINGVGGGGRLINGKQKNVSE